MTIYTEIASEAVARESREELEFTDARGEVFEPPYEWILSFDDRDYSFEVFTTTIGVHDSVVSNEPHKAQLAWARLGQWRLYDKLTCLSVPVLTRLREFEEEHQHLPRMLTTLDAMESS